MSTEKILILSALAFSGSYFLTPWVRKLSEKVGAMDLPGKRKIHTEPTARGGGVAIFLGFFLAFLFLNRLSPEIIGFAIGAFVIVGVGVLDDMLGLSALPKFIFQALAALIVIYSGTTIDLNMALGGKIAGFNYLSMPLTFLWIVGITNAINIIDGLDGLAAGVSTISAFTISAVAFLLGRPVEGTLALMLGCAALGFLPHNFRSRIFMGDLGSMFLGYSLATISVMGMVKISAAFSLFVPLIILAIPIFDTLFAITRRIVTRKPIYEGDQKHIHHRFLDMGFSSLQTVIFMYVLSFFFAGLAILSAMAKPKTSYMIFLASVVLVVFGGWILVIVHQKKTGLKN